MKIELFERWLNLNRNIERVMVNLKHLESMDGLDRGSIVLYARDTEQLRISVNRYLAQMVETDADRAEKAMKPDTPEPEEEEP